MHTRSQSLLIGHSTKERGQHISLVCRQRDQQRVLVTARQPANGLQRFASFVGVSLALAALAIGATWAIARPTRGPHDWLAGTWIVPR